VNRPTTKEMWAAVPVAETKLASLALQGAGAHGAFTCHRTPCAGRVMRCDHCRGPLGPFVHRYWRMRFCSKACEAAYLARLNPQTRQKLAEGIRRRAAMPDRDRNAI